MKDLVVFETHCRYFAVLLLEDIHILSSSLSPTYFSLLPPFFPLPFFSLNKKKKVMKGN